MDFENKKKKIVLGIIVLCVLVAMILVGVLVVSNQSKNKNKQPSSTVSDNASSNSANEKLSENDSDDPYAKVNEYEALCEFAQTGNNIEKLGWNLKDCNTWTGIAYDKEGYVCAINLPYLELEGDLDVSGFPNLIAIDCSSNVLSKLNVNNCGKLEYLQCYYNNLSELQLNNCASLVILDCSDNQIKKLDLSTLSSLEDMSCGSNQLIDITLPTSNKISSFHCEYNYLQDLSKIKALEGDNKGIYYEPQQVRGDNNLAISDVALLKMIMNQSQVDENLMWDANNLENCYGVEWTYKEGTYYINSLILPECEIEGTLSVSGLEELQSFVLPMNKLQGITIKNCAKLETIDLAGNQLKDIQLSNIPNLSMLDISYNYLTKKQAENLKATYDVASIEYRAESQFVDADMKDFDQNELKILKDFFGREENKGETSYLDFSDPGTIDELTWEPKQDGKCHVTGIDFSYCEISGAIDLSSFQYLENVSFKGSEIEKVVLPDSLKEIQDEAFSYCDYLESIVIPKNVEKIGSNAFNECESLREVEFLCKNADVAFDAFNETYGIETVYCYGNTEEMSTNFFGNPKIKTK